MRPCCAAAERFWPPARARIAARSLAKKQSEEGEGTRLPGSGRDSRGLIDRHTHPVFAEPRLVDFEKRIGGAGYEEIAAAGGGIGRASRGTTVQPQRAEQEGARGAQRHAGAGNQRGGSEVRLWVTLEDEIKSLEAICDAARQWPGEVVPTLLAAHVVPQEYAGKADEYVEKVCDEMIPLAAKKKLAKYVDVFCDRGALRRSRRKRYWRQRATWSWHARTRLPVHASETKPLLEHQPASFDHMDCGQPEDISMLARRRDGSSPAAGSKLFSWAQRISRRSALIDADVPVALATDYNPGTSPTPSMPFVLSLACTHMKMMPAEAIAAATLQRCVRATNARQKRKPRSR